MQGYTCKPYDGLIMRGPEKDCRSSAENSVVRAVGMSEL